MESDLVGGQYTVKKKGDESVQVACGGKGNAMQCVKQEPEEALKQTEFQENPGRKLPGGVQVRLASWETVRKREDARQKGRRIETPTKRRKRGAWEVVWPCKEWQK